MNINKIEDSKLIQFLQIKQSHEEHQKKVSLFMEAARKGDIESLKKSLDSKTIKNIDVRDPTTSQIAVEVAALYGQKFAVHFLIEKGARFETVSNKHLENVFALYFAAQVQLDLLAKTIAPDALRQVVNYLLPREAITIPGLVCKSWNRIINSADQQYWKGRYRRMGGIVNDVISSYEKERLSIPRNLFQKLCCFPDMALGREKWMKLLGVDVGIEPPLPPDIHHILNSPCPFWAGKTVKETHTLVLRPESVLLPGKKNWQPLTLKLFGGLIKKFFPESKDGYDKDSYFDKFGDIPFGPSRWVLMTNDVIPGSRNMDYKFQQELVSKAAHYMVPTLINAGVSIVMDYMSNGKTKLNREDRETWTRTQELGQYGQMIVGGCSPAGLDINNSRNYAIAAFGVAGGREL